MDKRKKLPGNGSMFLGGVIIVAAVALQAIFGCGSGTERHITGPGEPVVIFTDTIIIEVTDQDLPPRLWW